MAGRAELPKRKPVAIHDLPPNVRAFAEHLAAAVAADILREIPAGDWAKIGRKSALDPTSVLTKERRATVRAHRDELIEALPPQPAEPSVQAELDLANATAIATHDRLGAVLIRSPRFGAVWLALELSMVAELVAEEADWVKLGDPARPVPRALHGGRGAASRQVRSGYPRHPGSACDLPGRPGDAVTHAACHAPTERRHLA